MNTHLSLSRVGNDIPVAPFSTSGRHAAITAASGSGKTTAAHLLLDHDIADGRKIVIVDSDDRYSQYGLLASDHPDQDLPTYLSSPRTTPGFRVVTDSPQLLAETLKTVFNQARLAPQGITLVVDDLTPFLQVSGSRSYLAQAISNIAERGRNFNIWAIWVAQSTNVLPESVLATARLMLIGQHKDGAKVQKSLPFVDSEMSDSLPHLRTAEFLVWSSATNSVFTTTLRPPARGQLSDITYPVDLGGDDTTADDLVTLYEFPLTLYRQIDNDPDVFTLLAVLTGVNTEKANDALRFVELQAAREESGVGGLGR